MARLSDLKLAYRLFMQAYPYRRVDWRPGARLEKPLHAARIALVTSAGLSLPDQPPFDSSVRGGDWSFREIPADADLTALHIGQTSDAFDHRGIEADRNLAFPLDRLKELAQEGSVGTVAPRHYSLMGSIAAPGRLMARTAPEIARRLAADRVDGVLLTPV
jgi:D-proline reductase (dithiol) PrdB